MGEAIPDWLIVQLIKKQIDSLFPEKTEEDFIKEYQQKKDFIRGWVLVDYPKTEE
jgi:hypothetical protein